MSQSTHQLAIKGKDQTGAAFASVENHAAAAGAKIRSVLGGALAAAGAYLSFRAVANAVNELGTLSDVAQKTSTSVDELTRAATAMGVLGINADINGLAKAFQLMEKNTGRSGLQGFYDTISELGRIPEISDRAAAAMKAFGKSGLEFMPLVNAASESTAALRNVIDAMPAVSQAAADAGDEAADAMAVAGKNVKSIWLNAIGRVVAWFSENYEGGVREAAVNASTALAKYAEIAAVKCISWAQKIQQHWESMRLYWEKIGDRIGAWRGGMSWEEAGVFAEQQYDMAISVVNEKLEELDAIERRRTESIRKEFEDREAIVEKFTRSYAAAAKSTAASALGMADAAAFEGAARSPVIRNELMMGGSAAALRTAVLGPQYQSEQKKQTALLQRIADNTAKTADNTDDVPAEHFEEIN